MQGQKHTIEQNGSGRIYIKARHASRGHCPHAEIFQIRLMKSLTRKHLIKTSISLVQPTIIPLGATQGKH
jgi:hypothetical protein